MRANRHITARHSPEGSSRVTRHLKGLLITATGIVLLSPDSLIIRLIDTSHANVLFWRGLLVFQGMLLLITWVHGRQSVQAFRAIGLPGVGAMFMWTLSSLFFVSALFHTSVANTLVLLSTSPVFAAFVSWLWLRETIGLHTVLAIVVLTASVGLIVSDGYQQGHWAGDLFALGASLCLACTFVFTRKAGDCDMTPAVALSGLLVALIALPFATPLPLSLEANLLFALLGIVLTISLTLLFVGPRYIPAPEVSLMLPLETVLGTGLVWLVLDEQPTASTLLGGAIVIATLIVHSMVALRRSRRHTTVSAD